MLVLVAGAVVYLTLIPFGVRVPTSLGAALTEVVSFDALTPAHMVPAFLLALLARAGWGISPKRAAATVMIGLVSLEIAQAFIEHRHARLGDLVAQSVGVGLACFVRPPVPSAWVWRSAWAGVLVAMTVSGLVLGIRGQHGHTLGPMDTTFRLVVGDEHGGQRPWLGEVHGFEISAGDTPESADVLLSYAETPTEPPWLGEGPHAVELHPADGGWSSLEPVPGLCRAIDEARGVGVSLDLTPASADQEGPARIVTLSKGLSYRNLTIGQEDDALVCRIRTPRSGRNASSPQFVFPGVLVAGERQRIRVWTDGGSARLWVANERARERVSYITPRDWLGLRPGLGNAAGVLALFGPLGLAAGMLLGPGRSRWIVGVLTPIVILGVVWGVSLVLDRPIAWWLLAGSVGVSGAGVALSASLGRGRH